jgi:hypothetical protein
MMAAVLRLGCELDWQQQQQLGQRWSRGGEGCGCSSNDGRHMLHSIGTSSAGCDMPQRQAGAGDRNGHEGALVRRGAQ